MGLVRNWASISMVVAPVERGRTLYEESKTNLMRNTDPSLNIHNRRPE